ncbi:sulfotransferase family protein [Cohnella kolymensis]|uniref:sulfotransferase family protein n=1 Tax=Cohnella kolymensis TaxID=1590652 RepID=UPI00069707CF|nr:sulfotransferase [Cohnella kolymensis]
MIDSSGRNLVFMLCVPRSGSSLAATLLQKHSKVYAAQEMWFLMSLYDLRKVQPRAYGGAIILDRFYNGMLTDDMYERACRAFAVQTYNELLQTAGAQIALDKSPRYYYLLEFLDKLFPQSQRIWLLRNPLSIIASYKKANSHNHTRFHIGEDLCDSKFNINMTDVTAGLLRYYHYFSGDNPNTYRLYYEGLAARPQQEMEKLCGFLGIDYEDGLDHYGDILETPKGSMYTSMGVGDPFLFADSKPHERSINNWKDILDKREVEMYCRVIGADLFHKLGYSEQIQEAENWTGARFDAEPNYEFIQSREKQLQELTGCRWEPGYQMRTDVQHTPGFSIENFHANTNSELMQMQITLQALERRLEKSYIDQNRLKSQLSQMRSKIDRVKSMIPFGTRLTQWASKHLLNSGRGR